MSFSRSRSLIAQNILSTTLTLIKCRPKYHPVEPPFRRFHSVKKSKTQVGPNVGKQGKVRPMGSSQDSLSDSLVFKSSEEPKQRQQRILQSNPLDSNQGNGNREFLEKSTKSPSSSSTTDTMGSNDQITPEQQREYALLKPTSIERIADTSWYLVSTSSKLKYFYNKHTKEMSSKLPASVKNHVEQLRDRENEANLSRVHEVVNKASSSSEPSLSTLSSYQSSKEDKTIDHAHLRAAPVDAEGSSKGKRNQRATAVKKTRLSLLSQPYHFIPSPMPPPPIPTIESQEERSSLVKQEQIQKQANGIYSQGVEPLETPKAPTSILTDTQDEPSLSLASNEKPTSQPLPQGKLADPLPLVEQGQEPNFASTSLSMAATSLHTNPKSINDPFRKLNQSILEMGERMIRRGKAEQVISSSKAVCDLLIPRFINNHSTTSPSPFTLTMNSSTPSSESSLNYREKSSLLANLILRTQAFVSLRDFTNAQQCATYSRDIDPNHAAGYSLLGLVANACGKHTEALKWQQESLDIDPHYIPAYLRLARYMMDSGEGEEALRIIREAHDIHPDNYEINVMMITILGEMDLLLDASTIAVKLMKEYPNRPEAFIEQTVLLMQVRDFDSALTCISQALIIDQEVENSWVLYGQIKLVSMINNSEKNTLEQGYSALVGFKVDTDLARKYETDAEAAFQVALSINPTSVPAHVGLSTIAYNRKQISTSLNHTNQALKINTNSADAWYNKARCEMDERKFQEAIESLQACLKLVPSNEEVLLLLGVCYQSQGMTKPCNNVLEQVEAINPYNPKLWINKGFLLQSTKNFSESLDCFNKAIKIDPNDEEAKMGRISALFSMGRGEEANIFYSTFKSDQNQETYKTVMNMANMAKSQLHSNPLEVNLGQQSSANDSNGAKENAEGEISNQFNHAFCKEKSAKPHSIQADQVPGIDGSVKTDCGTSPGQEQDGDDSIPLDDGSHLFEAGHNPFQNIHQPDSESFTAKDHSDFQDPKEDIPTYDKEMQSFVDLFFRMGIKYEEGQIVLPEKLDAKACTEYIAKAQTLHEEIKKIPRPNLSDDNIKEFARQLDLKAENVEEIYQLNDKEKMDEEEIGQQAEAFFDQLSNFIKK